MYLLLGFEVIGVQVQAQALPPESSGAIEFHTGWDDQIWHADDYWPAACGVRFPVPVHGDADMVEITIDSMAIGYLPCPGGTQVTLTETVTVYTGGNNYPAQKLADFTFTYDFNPGMGYIFKLRPDSILHIPYEGWPRDTIVVWIVAYNMLYNGGDDTVFVGMDNTNTDPYTSGINFVNEGDGWVDIYTTYGVGYDWIMTLYYTESWTQVEENPSRPFARLQGGKLVLGLAEAGPVRVEAYDPAGRLAFRAERRLGAGRHEISLPLKRGVWLVRVEAPGVELGDKALIR